MNATAIAGAAYNYVRAIMNERAIGFRFAPAGEQLAMILSAAYHAPGPSEDETLTARLDACANVLAAMGDRSDECRAHKIITQIADLVDALEREIA